MDYCGKDLFWFKSAVTLFRSSIGYGIQSISESEPFLGLCRIQNLVVDLHQEELYIFATKLKADSDSGVTPTKKKLCGVTRQCDLTKVEEDALKTKLSFKGSGLLW